MDHARAIEIAFKAHEVEAFVVTGETPADIRAKAIARYRKGELRAMINVNVLTVGFDAPATDLLAVMRPTVSSVLWCQMIRARHARRGR